MLIGQPHRAIGGGGTLLVIAHPDDECMFFVPTIRALSLRAPTLRVLCLSTGDYDGLGAVRKVELLQACARLGIGKELVTVVDDPRLQDGPHTYWPADAIADIINNSLVQQQQTSDSSSSSSSVVITFDEHGVTGHANHIAVNAGARLAAQRNKAISLYELRTVGIARRFFGAVDVVLVALVALLDCIKAVLVRRSRSKRDAEAVALGRDIICVNLLPWRCHQAMREHQSQYVWFRRIYVLLSRYVFVNTLHRHVAVRRDRHQRAV